MSCRFAIPAVVVAGLSIFVFSDRASSEPPAKKSLRGDQSLQNAQIAPVVEAGNQFAFDLYQRLRSHAGNIFFSPASISMALAMTYTGAAENTAEEMAKTLHFRMPKAQLDEGMRALLASWKTGEKKPGFRLDVANRLWGQEGYKFLDAYLQVTRVDYGAELARLDFHQPEAARQTINKWIEDKTQDKIKNLISSAGSLANARLVLTNAVYFKGDWREPFDKNGTQEADFHVSATHTVKTSLMHQKHMFRYVAPLPDLELLELPYGDGHLSMYVLLPKVDGLDQLEGQLPTMNLENQMASARGREVIVFLPKFRTTTEFELSNVLKAMGMASAFSPTANFSGMTGGKDLFISAVLHKAFVDVNEEGTEAAAATGVVMRPTAIFRPQPPLVFRADHPFLFLIRDNRTGATLFLGRVVDPTK